MLVLVVVIAVRGVAVPVVLVVDMVAVRDGLMPAAWPVSVLVAGVGQVGQRMLVVMVGVLGVVYEARPVTALEVLGPALRAGNAVLLRGAPGASAESLEDMIDIAITECERFFPAFQFVLWGGKSASDALDAAMLDCVGEA